MMGRYPEAVLLVEKKTEEAAKCDSASGRGALGVTRVDNAVLFSGEKQDVLLHVAAAAQHIQGQK